MSAPRGPVAIVGMGVHLPGAADLDTYWLNLRDGVDAVTDVPHGRHDPAFHTDGLPGPDRTYCHRGGFVDDHVALDLRRHGIVPSSVHDMEPDQLLALRVAADAIADAGGVDAVADPARTGVVLGRGGYLNPALARWEQRVRTVPQLLRTLRSLLPDVDDTTLATVRGRLLDDLGPHSPEATVGLVPNLAASRVANRLDLRGPAYTVDAACASSLLAVDQAVSELATGRCDAVLAGGVHHAHDETLWATFTELGALSRSGRSAPLSAGADGLLIGEGTGVVVLKRLADAQRDGNRVYAVITGSGVAADGRSAALFAPDGTGQEAAVRAAWREAGANPMLPGSVGMIEAHGTGTVAGDGAELRTLAQVFGPRVECHARAVIGSVKSMIGHTMPASGVASLVKAALALHHTTLLPTLHCDEPHPLLASTRFDVLGTAREWPRGAGPRRAGVDAFGFGGINAHVVLQEAPSTAAAAGVGPPATTTRPAPARVVRETEPVLRLVAATPAALRDQLAAITDSADYPSDDPGAGPVRLGVVGGARALATAAKIIDRAVEGRLTAWRGRADVWFTTDGLLPSGGTTFVFPGLEAAFAPRCTDLTTWLGASAPPSSPRVGDDLSAHSDAVMDVGRLVAAACERLRVRPSALVGHSVGEWAAMAVGGMFGPARSASDPAVLRRDHFPTGITVPDVEFAALGCDQAEAADRAATVDPALGTVVVSHDNAPRQSVVCGPTAALEALCTRCRADGVVARVLPFRSGFHTPALGPHLAGFRSLVRALPMHTPSTPVFSCTEPGPFPSDPDRCRELYLRHLVEPVRFRATVEALYAAGQRFFVVTGPGQTGSFVSDTLGDRPHTVVSAASADRDGLDQLARVATAFWVEGGDPDLDALRRSVAGPAGPRPAAPREATAAPSRDAATTGTGGIRATPPPTVALRLGTTPWAVPEPLPRPAPATPVGVSGGAVPGFEALPAPIAAGLAALRAETDQATAAVLAALGAAPRTTTAAAAAPTVTAAVRTGVSRSTSRPGGDGPPPGGVGPDTADRTVEISLDALPELGDHRFFRQRADWPDETDRRPVLPATATIALAVDAARSAWPGTVVTGVRDARFDRWLVAAPARRITIRLRADDGRIAVTVGDAASLTLLTGPAPAAGPPCARPGPERPPGPLGDVYGNRVMFHGPAYQGLGPVHGIGDGHARATVTVPAGTGALLDNVGQLLGVWMFAHCDDGLLAFPHRIAAIDLHSPLPGPGSQVEVLVRATAPDPQTLLADAEVVHDGLVVATVRGWRDARMDCDREAHRTYAFPDRTPLSRPQPGGWWLVEDRWTTAAARDLHAGVQLAADERDRYAALDPRRRRSWLAGRIAAKDAVRAALGGGLFPAEITVGNDDTGRPVVGRHHAPGPSGPVPSVSIAHTGSVGVALAGPAGSAPGIDVEPVRPVPPSTRDVALDPAEHSVLAALESVDPGSGFARLWTAKEAAAKARGTGLEGAPRRFRVLSADVDGAVVVDPDGAHHLVHHHLVSIAGAAHVVARTGGGVIPTDREETP